MKLAFFIKLIPKVSLLRSMYYSIKYKGVIVIGKGAKVNIHKKGNIEFLSNKSSLYLGVHTSVTPGAVLDIKKNGILKVGKSVGLHRGVKTVIFENAILTIGNDSFVNENSRIQCKNTITIGHSTSIGWNCTICDSDQHGIYIDDKLINKCVPIFIGDNVWICANTSITKGVKINSNCIIGINSLVLCHEYESNFIYAGNPAKKVKTFERWGSL
jgi:acetyltransferase-like isoleucine patch superfamily enzyme